MVTLSRRAQNKIATHDRILNAALGLFAQKSYELIHIEDICADAGIARATFFKYFPSKIALIEAFGADLLVRVDGVMDDFAANSVAFGAFEMLEVMRAVCIDEWRRFGMFFTQLIEKGDSAERMAMEASIPGLEDRVAEIIDLGQRQQQLSGRVDPAIIATSIVAGWRKAIINNAKRDDTSQGAENSRQVLDAVFYGIALYDEADER